MALQSDSNNLVHALDWKKMNNLIPTIIQDSDTLQILMLGYSSKESLEKTIADQKVTFYSRSKNRLWTKGEESGNFLTVRSITTDCDHDTLLILAAPTGPTCHTGSQSCFKDSPATAYSFLDTLWKTILNRHTHPLKTSYTSQLFTSGIDRMSQKVGEEAVETVIAAKNSDPKEFIDECSDLIYHILVLIKAKKLRLSDIINRLKERHNGSKSIN